MDTATFPRDRGTSETIDEQESISQLVVTWQHPILRDISPIGLLGFDGHEYSFAYLASAPDVVDFRPLLGFPDFERRYTSETLFQLFLQRAMDPRRPDFLRYVEDLGLSDDASPWEQISRSGGARGSDTLQLFPVPRFTGEGWTCYFLVHGTRHLLLKDVMVGESTHVKYSADELEQVLDSLSRGDNLQVEHEISNQFSKHALLATNVKGAPVGWVPNWLAAEVLQLQAGGLLSFEVDRVNPPEAGWHMRLVVKVVADCPEEYAFFTGPNWATLA